MRLQSRHRLGMAPLWWAMAACGPPIDPSWLITEPRELALDVALTEQGPYGERVESGPRTHRDALPLDTITLRPVIADAQGRVDNDALEGIWVLCSGIGNCLLRDEVADLPVCDGSEIQPLTPCTFGEGAEGVLTIPDLPPTLSESSTIFTLVSGPTVGLLASTPEGPGLDACIARLDARESLDGCLLMERTLGLGPLGDLVDSLESLGLDPGIEQEAESLLARPRNRNPAAERILVSYDREAIEVDVGGSVSVPPNTEITLELLTTEDDDDSFDAMVGEDLVTFTEELGSQWWFDRPIDRTQILPLQMFTRLRSGAVTDSVRAHVVVRDNLGGEGWGFIDLDFGG